MTVTKFFEVGQKFPQILTLKTFRDMGTTELLLILKLQLVLWYLYHSTFNLTINGQAK